MTNRKQIIKRLFGLLMACVFLFSGVFGMDGVWLTTFLRASATDDLTFTVPETIYLQPCVGGSTHMQYYLNVNPDGSVPQGYSTQGSVYFSKPSATQVQIVCGNPGVTLSTGTGTNTVSATIGGQLQSSVPSGTTQLLTWTATYTENGRQKQVQTYSVLYAPAEDPAGAIAAANAYKSGANVYASCSTMIYGAQTISAGPTTLNLSGDVCGSVTIDGRGKYVYPLPCHTCTPQMYAGAQPPMTSNLLRSVDNNTASGTAYGFVTTDHTRDMFVAGGIGKIGYDVSRVNKIGHIPNFYIHSFLNGADCDEGFSRADDFSEKAYYFISGSSAADTSATYAQTQYWSGNYRTQSVVSVSSPNVSGIALNGGYKTLYSAITRSWKVTSTLSGSERAQATAAAACEFYGINKSGVRALYLHELSQARQCGADTQAWTTYQNQMRSAAAYLGTPMNTESFNMSALTSAAQAVANSSYVYLTLAPNGGTWQSGSTSAQVARQTAGSTYALPTNLTRSGYTLAGWQKADGSTVSGTYTFGTADETLTAQWTVNTFTLTLDPNGGAFADGSTANRIVTKPYGSAYTLPTDLQKAGFSFAGWQTAAGGTVGACYTFDAGNETLTAKWGAADYTVTVHKDEGLWLPYSGTPLADFAKETKTYYGTAGGVVTLPTYGCSGGGLNAYVRLNGSGTSTVVGSYTFGTQNETLYSQWGSRNALMLSAGGGRFADSAYTHSASQRILLYDDDYYGMVTTYNGTACTMFRMPDASNLSRDGYSFSGWTLQNGSTGALLSNGMYYVFDPNTVGVSEAIAQWTRNRFTLILSGFAGVTSGSDWEQYAVQTNRIEITQDAGSVITLPTAADVYNPGNTFLGWFYLNESDSAGGRTTFTLTQDTCLYARWTRNTYTLTLDLNGGYTEVSRPGYTYPNLYRDRTVITESQQYGYTVHLSSLHGEIYPKEGYAFVGWQPSSGSWVGSVQMEENTYGAPSRGWYTFGIGDETLVAQYETVDYTLTFDTGGGEMLDSMVYTVESTDTLPAAVKTGYTFDGWKWIPASGTYVDPNYACWQPTSIYPAHTVLTGQYGSVTLTAQWTIDVHTVTFDPAGGTWPDDNTTAAYTSTGSIGDALILPDEPEKEGYSFVGWQLSDGSTGTFDSSTNQYVYGTTDDTLTAQWTANTYTVAYDGNGATGGVTADSTHTYDTAQTLTANGFERAFAVTYNYNYENAINTTDAATASFNGWNDAADGSGTGYADEESVLNLTSTDGETVTLYAQWTDGSVTLPKPSRPGYTFDGWFTDTDFATLVGMGYASYTPGGEITLYAKWHENGMLRLKYDTSPGGRPLTPGATVTVTAEMCSNPGLISLMLDLHYDTTALELIQVNDLQLFGTNCTFFPHPNLNAEPYRCIWSDDTAPQNHTEIGDMVEYTFRVRTTAQIGPSTVWLSYDPDNTLDYQMNPVELTTQSVDLPICAMRGDVNADLVISLHDLLTLTWYFQDPASVTIAAINADIDTDGDVDADDQTMLSHYFVGGYGVILP
ncbi:MAG: InlB B-repeat-containing protein [Clostridia bacterium]|nr:InlB B-repeat-containing protein [Clostridia bacterium]